MSVWNAILQATHSALIDELNERFPEEKLELGLPKRFDGYGEIGTTPQVLFWETLSAAEGKGFTALAGAANQSAKELSDIFSKARTRTEKEFKTRGIAASYGASLPAPPTARMTIWLPISIRFPNGTQTFDLALGVII